MPVYRPTSSSSEHIARAEELALLATYIQTQAITIMPFHPLQLRQVLLVSLGQGILRVHLGPEPVVRQ